MKLKGARVLLTGANGGIGSAIADELAAKGAVLALVGQKIQDTTILAAHLQQRHPEAIVHAFGANLLDADACETVVRDAQVLLGDIDILINCAGLMSFRPFDQEQPEVIERIVQLNLIAPMLLVREVLPAMLARRQGQIVNIGSTFGSIGFAWFAAYSASKFGLRGLSEALRRELHGTGVNVTYVAPRAVKTALNSDAVYRMAEQTGMSMDSPEWVARQAVAAIEKDAKDVYLGFPEKFFARLNALWPRFVDGGLRGKNQVMADFAREG